MASGSTGKGSCQGANRKRASSHRSACSAHPDSRQEGIGGQHGVSIARKAAQRQPNQNWERHQVEHLVRRRLACLRVAGGDCRGAGAAGLITCAQSRAAPGYGAGFAAADLRAFWSPWPHATLTAPVSFAYLKGSLPAGAAEAILLALSWERAGAQEEIFLGFEAVEVEVTVANRST